jgi:inosose dehydratase
MEIGTGAFRWTQHYRQQGLSLDDHLDEVIAAAGRAGCKLWEPLGLANAEVAPRLEKALKANGVRLASLYVNCRLHDAHWKESVEAVLEQARWAKRLGATIICTNPEPLDWKQPLDKDDDQLSIQLGAMFMLCQQLRAEEMRLAYHVHSSELRQKGHEFYYMMDNMPAELMDFCFDPHWIYRGFGNRQKAVDDVLKRYGNRIISLHLRQSVNGIWTETLGEGDVDYRPLAKHLKESGFTGPVYVELGYEEGVSQTLSMEEAHRQSVVWLKGLLGY